MIQRIIIDQSIAGANGRPYGVRITWPNGHVGETWFSSLEEAEELRDEALAVGALAVKILGAPCTVAIIAPEANGHLDIRD